MIEPKTAESAPVPRAKNTVVFVFAVLGFIVPIAFHFLSYYVDQQPRAHYNLGRFLWSVIPYLWPSAGVLLPAHAGDIRDSIVFWAMSLVLNVAIYSAVGFGLSRLSGLVAKLQRSR